MASIKIELEGGDGISLDARDLTVDELAQAVSIWCKVDCRHRREEAKKKMMEEKI